MAADRLNRKTTASRKDLKSHHFAEDHEGQEMFDQFKFSDKLQMKKVSLKCQISLVVKYRCLQ